MQNVGPFQNATSVLVRLDVLRELVLYAGVSVAALAVDAGTLFALTEFANIHYLASGSAGFALGLATNYALSTRFVFGQRTMSGRYVEFLIFAAIGLAGLGLTQFLLWFCTEVLSAHYMLSKAIAVAVVFAWNFGARKVLLFS